MSDLIRVEDATREYRVGGQIVRAVDGVSLTLPEGGMVALLGPSGSGKTTLLHLIGGLERPTSGRVAIEGVDLAVLGDKELTELRRKKAGFVFQSYNLVPSLTALENVMLPLEFARVEKRQARERARRLLESVGLGDRFRHAPRRLSGGEQQRVAIARALANDPSLVLADEPTGNLDSKTGADVVALLHQTAGEGRTVVVATHDEKLVHGADRILHIRDGRLVEPG